MPAIVRDCAGEKKFASIYSTTSLAGSSASIIFSTWVSTMVESFIIVFQPNCMNLVIFNLFFKGV
jgi:hypothetical protein